MLKPTSGKSALVLLLRKSISNLKATWQALVLTVRISLSNEKGVEDIYVCQTHKDVLSLRLSFSNEGNIKEIHTSPFSVGVSF